MLVYQTEPLAEPVEVTGRARRPPAHLVVRGRHRLHREADRRLPAERGLSGGLRHADQRLDHPLPLPQRLRAGGADGAGRRSTRSRSCCRRRRTCSPPATASGSTSRRRTSRGSSATRTPASRSAGTRTRSSRSRPCTAARVVAARDPCVIDWVPIPAGPFPMGDDPARRLSAGRGRDAAAGRPVEAFRIGARAGHRSDGDGDDR